MSHRPNTGDLVPVCCVIIDVVYQAVGSPVWDTLEPLMSSPFTPFQMEEVVAVAVSNTLRSSKGALSHTPWYPRQS